MKKIILVAAMVLGFAVAASAQPRALGIRGGYGAELSYQHSVGGANFVEADLGLTGSAFNLVATHNWMIAQPAWTSRGEWGFYLGAGAGVAMGNKSFYAGVAGQIGLEYTFSFPLQLSIDWRPQIGLVGGAFGWWSSVPCLGIRYRF
ncbi:MAG: hypothetical protein IJX11_05635 [Bacteroidales bacterium]|nr:hypothetical protein [Bacteroidales bacterium]